jgi:hypothetical protein
MIFVSNLYDVRRRVQGTERMKGNKIGNARINITFRQVRVSNDAVENQLNLRFIYVFHVYTAEDSPRFIEQGNMKTDLITTRSSKESSSTILTQVRNTYVSNERNSNRTNETIKGK